MKTKLPTLVLTGLMIAATFGCSNEPTTNSSQLAAVDYEFSDYYDLTDFKGQTYLQFMKDVIKPAMDELATDGYKIADGETIANVYGSVDAKVQRKVRRWGLDKVMAIADQLAGKTVTLNDLPQKIRQIDPSVDIYGLATFLGLASGGDISIKYYDDNYGVNVHYDVHEQRSGRSFGVGPTRKANDASDKQFLTDLQSYTEQAPDDLNDFYKTMFEALLNSDSSHYRGVEKEGQTVLTDFLSVFTAEQARNLMDGRVSPHWDAALLEVTLLAAFHAGQEELKLFYRTPGTNHSAFTSETLRQTPCSLAERTKTAALADYWQFSRNIDSEKNCRRSGINVTKREFRKLGKELTQYVAEFYPEIHTKVANATNNPRSAKNLFEGLSYFLISDNVAAQISPAKVKDITSAWVAFLEIIRTDADDITQWIDQAE